MKKIAEKISRKIALFFKLEQEIHDYFGYHEDWVKIPIVDFTDSYWVLDEDARGEDALRYSDLKLTGELLEAGEKTYSASIYYQRFLKKWVYRTKEYTMISMDTHCDGNRYIGIFDNTKEQKEFIGKHPFELKEEV